MNFGANGCFLYSSPKASLNAVPTVRITQLGRPFPLEMMPDCTLVLFLVTSDSSLCDGEHDCCSVCDNADWMNEAIMKFIIPHRLLLKHLFS